jgi:hypothetical protein
VRDDDRRPRDASSTLRAHRQRARRAGFLAAGLLALSGVATAQELEPRSYVNTPVGMNFLVAGYAYTEGDVVTDPSLPLEDAEIEAHSAVLAYARSFGFLGKSAKVDAIVPHSWIDGTASFQDRRQERVVQGFNDPRLRLSVNFYGAPALTLPAFLDYRQDLILGASLQVGLPLGQYDEDRLVNIGNNRWLFKPELGVSKALGPFIIEVTPSVTLYTDNDDFFGGHTREQDPIYAVQAHLVYRVREFLWGALDATWYGGGRTTIDGEKNDDRQSNARLGLTLALSVTRHHSIKLYGSKAVATRVGGDYDVFGLALQYRWGGGL